MSTEERTTQTDYSDSKKGKRTTGKNRKSKPKMHQSLTMKFQSHSVPFAWKTLKVWIK